MFVEDLADGDCETQFALIMKSPHHCRALDNVLNQIRTTGGDEQLYDRRGCYSKKCKLALGSSCIIFSSVS
jgi:hypothetical protein